MATTPTTRRCCVCRKERGAFTCDGCSQSFCRNDLKIHLETFSGQLEEMCNDYDELQQAINEQRGGSGKHPLIQQVDHWEEESIKRIKQTADECRRRLIDYMHEHINEMETQLNKLAVRLKQTRQGNEFNEIDLNELKEKLTKLDAALKTPLNVSVEQERTSFIGKISVILPNREDRMAISSGIEKLKGIWYLVDGENFASYMKELGVGFAMRQSSKFISPTITIREHEGKWSFRSESMFASSSYEFVPGVEFNETRVDGGHVTSVIHFENDKWIHLRHDKNGKESTLVRWIDDQGQQQIEMTCGGVKARRWYKRVA